MSPAPKDIDAYLAALPVGQRAVLQKLRQTIKATAPEAVESISYQMPTFKYKGRPLIYFGAAKNHCAVYGMSSVFEAHKSELEPYVTSKGTIRFPADKPLPAALVKKLVKAQMKAIESGVGGYKKKRSRKENDHVA